MDILQIYRGDTLRLTVTLTDSGGKPFVPAEGQQVVFSVGWPGEVLVAVPVTEGAANLTHQDTARLLPNEYCFDVRVYNADKTLVATPIFGKFIVKEAVNDALQL